MDDLISRAAAIEIASGYCHPANIAEELGRLPSADAVEVRHGYWVHDGLDIPHGVDWMHCSECGRRDKYCPAAMTNYCPSCGSRMDGEKNGRLNQQRGGD